MSIQLESVEDEQFGKGLTFAKGHLTDAEFSDAVLAATGYPPSEIKRGYMRKVPMGCGRHCLYRELGPGHGAFKVTYEEWSTLG